MATGKRPDPARRKTLHPHSTAFKVPCGTKDSGYKAGELYGCYTHRTFAAQPCVADITNGALQCPLCAANVNCEWRGYVPIWDRDFTLRHVLIGEAYFESVDAIPFHAQVTLSRAKNPISPLVIREEPSTFRALPNKSPWNCEVCMMAVCLTLWKNDALTKWCEANQPLALRRNVNAPPVVKVAPKTTPYKGVPSEGAGEADFSEVVNRIRSKGANLKPSSNGNGQH
jgi:hypothetical protein